MPIDGMPIPLAIRTRTLVIARIACTRDIVYQQGGIEVIFCDGFERRGSRHEHGWANRPAARKCAE